MTPERRRIFGILGVLCAMACLVSLTYYLVEYRPTDTRSARERTFTDLTLTLDTGGTLDTTTFDGMPVIVVAWATWCPSCVDALRAASDVKVRFDDNVHVIAVNRTEERAIIEDYRRITALPENITYAHDDADAYFTRVGGQSMPEVVVYDGDGTVIAHLISVPSVEELAHYIDSVL